MPARLQCVACLCVAVLLIAGGFAPAHAQVNVERMRVLDVNGWRTSIGGDVALESGNSDVFEVGARFRQDVRQGKNVVFLVGELRYGEEEGDAFRDRAFAHLRYNRTLAPWLIAEAFTQVQEDRFKLLQLRTLVGGGLRIRYVDGERIKIFQGTTPMYEYENLNASEVIGHPVTVSTVRWSNYLNIRVKLTDRTSLFTTTYVQPRVNAFADVRALNETTLAVGLTKHVTLRVQVDVDYDSRPPDNVEDLDVILRNGITVTF